MSNNYVESVFGMSEVQFIQTCDKFPCLKERELILDIYTETFARIGVQHLHHRPNEKNSS